MGNTYLSASEFWNIKDDEKLDSILYITFETIRVASILLQPYCPSLTKNILDFIKVDPQERYLNNCHINLE